MGLENSQFQIQMITLIWFSASVWLVLHTQKFNDLLDLFKTTHY